MSLYSILKDLTINKGTTLLNNKELPSQGYFYSDDFWIRIKKADVEDIIEYTHYFNSENPLLTIELIKEIVRRNSFVAKGFDFEYIRAIDIVYIFLDIVKITKDKKLFILEENPISGIEYPIEICANNFNYFIPNSNFKYNKEELCFEYKGFKFRFPSIGVEESIFKFTSAVAYNQEFEWMADDYNYDFSYFLGDRTVLTVDEVKNLLTIFRDDISDSDKATTSEIIDSFRPMFKYSLKWNDRVIPLDQRVGLKNIWD